MNVADTDYSLEPEDDKSGKTTDTVKPEKTESKTATLEERVNAMVSSMVKNDKGEWEFADTADTDETLRYAALTERRRRDTQATYTQSAQKLKALTTANEKLAEHFLKSITANLTDEQREELDELKVSNPEAWRSKLDGYEQEAKKKAEAQLASWSKEGEEASTLEQRQELLAAFETRTNLKLTDEIIENELPAKLSKQLEAGELSFEEFLSKAETYLIKNKVIKGAKEKPDSSTTLNNLGGGGSPKETAIDADVIASYEKELY